MNRATRICAGLVLATAALEVALAVRPVRRAINGIDVAVLHVLTPDRPTWSTDVAADVVATLDTWGVRAAFWGTLLVLLVFRRLHALVAYLAVLLVASLAVVSLELAQGRMRPAGVAVLGSWDGFAHPAAPLALAAAVAVGALRTLAPAGAPRRRAAAVAMALLAAAALARLHLGLDHPTDVLAGLGLGWALPMMLFSLLLPDEAFPVRYRQGTRAHVELTPERRAAVIRAAHQQLGLRVGEIEPFGLAGSAGSMPMRLRLQDPTGPAGTVFGKLYNVTHLRSDRLYKLGRMVLYGRLEDEKPFSTVRRLVEYEDHMLRLLRDAGLPVPAPLGIIEITPEREYLILMELLEGAAEVGQVALTDAEVDDGLRVVRDLWEAGVAHRDIKPSNLLVRDGRVLLIDVAFATVRPTPWRQAVDLADMMLTLALSSSAERVYARALLHFAEDDLAEAFAASRSITLPTQLRERLRADGRDLVAQFRQLAPQRPPVAVQLWSVRRVLVCLAVLAGAVGAVAAVASYARVANLL